MDSISINQLLTATSGTSVGIDRSMLRIDAITTDSRSIRPGDLFWCLQGDRCDGHDFVAKARQRGAVASVVAANRADTCPGPKIVVDDTLDALGALATWYRTTRDLDICIGVTGSVGKTTTRRIVHSVLRSRFNGHQSRRNFNNRFGVPLSVLDIEHSHAFAVLELGASAVGDIFQLATIAQPNIGIVTAVTAAHLEGFGDEQAIARTKRELIQSLPPSGLAVLNGDDEQVLCMRETAPCRVVTVGEGRHNDLRATDVRVSCGKLTFQFDDNQYSLPLSGRHHLTAALCAIAVATECGLANGSIQRGLNDVLPASGRCQIRERTPLTLIDDTYNSSPRAFEAACELLADCFESHQRVLVTGDMLELGTQSAELHRAAGRAVVRCGIDRLFAAGQFAEDVAAGAVAAGMRSDQIHSCFDQTGLFDMLADGLRQGDAVLVKGSRGTRMERVVEFIDCQLGERIKLKSGHRLQAVA